ncbi:MAG: hypothetical protein KJ718_02025 [Nanoarchaeota archaeon]|nr:hypothetical protein [Nanoarchaeota archaeon]MBU1051312.1 hypothetical protein [Nanoarchaeota archaeon]MBU1988460.1 hypothetical protein [Nanoarchaeota archaeon]
MAVDIKNLIAAISPDVYCENVPDETGKNISEEVKKIVKQEGYLKAAEKAKLRESDYLDVFHVQATSGAFALIGLKAPIEKHSLVYDAFSQSLEPVYFWILDFVDGVYGGAEKLVDNFVSSAGSGHFAEMQGRATRMQEEAMKMMQTAGVLTKSVIQIIYDLKEFRMRLVQHDDLRSSNKRQRDAAMLSMKQIWMDNVDIKRQNSSIKAMALGGQSDFVTLLDAFMVADSLKSVDKLDLNDRVKRILQQRYSEFGRWIVESERELRKRFDIEKNYLRNQINSLKLYARWAKPYFKAARQLEQNAGFDANIVNAFNTMKLELVLLAKGKYDPKDDVSSGELPKSILHAKVRKYAPVALIEFKFRSIPERSDQKGGYSFRGKVEVNFTSFALNEDELQVLKEQVEEDDFGDVFKMVEGATDESLGRIKEDIELFLGEDEVALKDVGEEKDSKKNEDVNPFSALFAFSKKEKKKDLSAGIQKDNDYEKAIRNQAILKARLSCRKLYDTYKKAHGMPSFPPSVRL